MKQIIIPIIAITLSLASVGFTVMMRNDAAIQSISAMYRTAEAAREAATQERNEAMARLKACIANSDPKAVRCWNCMTVPQKKAGAQ